MSHVWYSLGAWVAVIVGACKVADFIDGRLDPTAKKAIGHWLQNAKPEERFARWPSQFVAVFDRIFGSNHLTWRCFLVSAAVSLILGTLCFVAFVSLAYEPPVGEPADSSMDYIGVFLAIVVALASVNVLADYVSLLETRLILDIITKQPGSSTSFILFFDLLATIFIFSLCLVGAWFMSEGAGILYADNYSSVWMTVTLPAVLQYFWPALLITTYFTSVWLWLYVIVGLGIKMLVRTGVWARVAKKKMGVRRFFDLDLYPLTAMAITGSVCATPIAIVLIYWFGAGTEAPPTQTPS